MAHEGLLRYERLRGGSNLRRPGRTKMVDATVKARWRIFVSDYVVAETRRVLVEKLGFSPRLGDLTQTRVRRRAKSVSVPASKHQVSQDPADTPILSAAIAAGVDLLVTNDAHLLALNPYQSLQIISMTMYRQILIDEGHLTLP